MDNKIILKVKAGSHLYGLATPQSDLDYIGVYLSTPEELLGLNHSEIIEDNIVSKKENGRNDKDAVDCKYYELRKFCQLALNNNPTILELLFAPEESIVEITEEGRRLINNASKFLCRRVKHSYCGYAFSQKQKSFIKTENLKKLVEARRIFVESGFNTSADMLYDHLEKEGLMGLCTTYTNQQDREVHLNLGTLGLTVIQGEYPGWIQLADLRFTNQKLKDVFAKIEERINKATGRKDEMLEKGYDPKFMSHTIRLLVEGKELLKTGVLVLPLQEKDYLLKCKLGQIPPVDMMNRIEELEQEVECCASSTMLPAKPDFNSVNKMVQEIYKKSLSGVYTLH
jgi:hypothetical protein